MAYDSRKLKTIKWLEKLACETRVYNRKHSNWYGHSDRLNHVFARFGRLYATDSFIIAYVEYPEERQAGELEWQMLESYTDDEGYLLYVMQYCDMEKPFNQDDFMQRYFPKPTQYANGEDLPKFDPNMLVFALKPFQINGIDPNMAFTPEKLVLSGHNQDVSMMVCMMGKRG